MRDWLVIQLAAPIASFGELAGNVRRGGRERPGKAALLGLLGAALGVRREDAEGQSALAEGYSVATRTFREGRIAQDFHTIQSLPRGRSAATRARALAQRGELATSISVREYRHDVLHEAAFSPRPGAHWSVEALAEALRRPAFALWLGRKSCPLAAPLHPRRVRAVDPEAAFAAAAAERPTDWPAALGFDPNRPPEAIRVAVETEERPRLADRAVKSIRRRDAPLDRVGWYFAEREELVYTPPTSNWEGSE